MQCEIPISLQEAVARIAEEEMLDCYFECRPNNGFTYHARIQRASLIEEISKPGRVFYEAGVAAQSRDTGVYIPFVHKVHGAGMLFIQTKRECRLNPEQLQESLERGRGSDIFSE